MRFVLCTYPFLWRAFAADRHSTAVLLKLFWFVCGHQRVIRIITLWWPWVIHLIGVLQKRLSTSYFLQRLEFFSTNTHWLISQNCLLLSNSGFSPWMRTNKLENNITSPSLHFAIALNTLRHSKKLNCNAYKYESSHKFCYFFGNMYVVQCGFIMLIVKK